jgi:hypothetical protein
MTPRKTHKQDNPEQSKRFIDMAREVGVDETSSAFDSAFGKVVRPLKNRESGLSSRKKKISKTV